jgi:hypothetical protein
VQLKLLYLWNRKTPTEYNQLKSNGGHSFRKYLTIHKELSKTMVKCLEYGLAVCEIVQSCRYTSEDGDSRLL